MMYRAHCQRVLDSVVRASVDDIQGFLLHFWQGMPEHLQPLLELDFMVDVIGYCDCLLYKVIVCILVASPLQSLPDSLVQLIRHLALQIGRWLEVALHGLPVKLCTQKFTVAKKFSKTMNQQASLTHLCQSSRNILRSTELVAQMIADWRELDLDKLIREYVWVAIDEETEIEEHHAAIARHCKSRMFC
jgi:hypothetical protein